jgi:VWA domain containing CoxE-like protein
LPRKSTPSRTAAFIEPRPMECLPSPRVPEGPEWTYEILCGVRTNSHRSVNLRRSLRQIVRTDGDIPEPPLQRRQSVARKLLLLIDVSGSMKLHTTDHLKIAHAVVQTAKSAEVFTFGTRLTRIHAIASHPRSRSGTFERRKPGRRLGWRDADRADTACTPRSTSLRGFRAWGCDRHFFRCP